MSLQTISQQSSEPDPVVSLSPIAPLVPVTLVPQALVPQALVPQALVPQALPFVTENSPLTGDDLNHYLWPYRTRLEREEALREWLLKVPVEIKCDQIFAEIREDTIPIYLRRRGWEETDIKTWHSAFKVWFLAAPAPRTNQAHAHLSDERQAALIAHEKVADWSNRVRDAVNDIARAHGETSLKVLADLYEQQQKTTAVATAC